MIIDVREEKYPEHKFVVYVWEGEEDNYFEMTQTTYSEEFYDDMNTWCLETFGRRARTAFNIFEFKKYKHLNWFKLKWTGEQDGNSSRG